MKDALNKLSNQAAPGPDGLPPSVYKYGGHKLIDFLVKIFRRSLDETEVPLSLREAMISPIFKGGDHERPASYRPIALTSHLSKILERVLREQLVNFLEEKGFLDNSQHGSRPGRSTLTQLLVQQEYILDQLIQGCNVDAIYLDYEKAYDKVDLGLLAKKVKNAGIRGKMGAWLVQFTMGRRQRVRVGDTVSKWTDVKSSVPQGSCLGVYFFCSSLQTWAMT